jgi:anti-anti-sigma factor
MQCSVHAAADVIIVRGDIDLSVCQQLGEVLLEQLDQAVDTVEVDLSEVTFFAAAGLHVLLDAAEAARRRGITLRIGRLSPIVATVLDVTGTRSRLAC